MNTASTASLAQYNIAMEPEEGGTDNRVSHREALPADRVRAGTLQNLHNDLGQLTGGQLCRGGASERDRKGGRQKGLSGL